MGMNLSGRIRGPGNSRGEILKLTGEARSIGGRPQRRPTAKRRPSGGFSPPRPALPRPGGAQRQPCTCLRQSCASRKPRTSRILRFEKSASFSPISRVSGTPGKKRRASSAVGMFMPLVSLPALKT